MTVIRWFRRRAPALLVAVTALIWSAGCGGTTTFEGAGPQTIVGALPPPPPKVDPPPPPPPPPPPRVEVRDNQIVIHEKIQFDLDKATIKPESNSLLDEIVATFQHNPQIKKVEIDGHASSDGDAALNQKLSDARAKAVLAYLVAHGVDKARVMSKGWGATKPIADNATEDGREKNRRVEFIILDQVVTKKKVEIDPANGAEKILDTTTTDVTTVPDAAAPTSGAKQGAKP